MNQSVDELFYSNPWLFDAKYNEYHDPMRQRSFGDRRDFYHNVWMIRRALGDCLSPTLIEFHCYNEYEKDETAKLLTEEERKHVRFFWLTFGDAKARARTIEGASSQLNQHHGGQ